jgi:hypothetical protein
MFLINAFANLFFCFNLLQVVRKIKTGLLLSNELMIGYAPLPHKKVPDAFRLVLTAYPEKTYADMNFIIQQIEKVGSTFSGDSF